MTNSIKENWLKEDIKCVSCGQVVTRQKGITKQSMKRLISFDYKNPQEWIWTFVMIGIVFMAWSYQADMAAYNNFMQHPDEFCMQYTQIQNENIQQNGLNGIEGLDEIDQTTTPWNLTV